MDIKKIGLTVFFTVFYSSVAVSNSILPKEFSALPEVSGLKKDLNNFFYYHYKKSDEFKLAKKACGKISNLNKSFECFQGLPDKAKDSFPLRGSVEYYKKNYEGLSRPILKERYEALSKYHGSFGFDAVLTQEQREQGYITTDEIKSEMLMIQTKGLKDKTPIIKY